MFLLNLAWNNLFFNLKRTILQILLISVALAALILFQGYVEYSREGMALGFIQKSGNIQIAKQDTDALIEGDELAELHAALSKFPAIASTEAVLKFSGIIGTDRTSAIFWGEAFDRPELHYGVLEGTPVFEDSESVVIGTELAKTLGIKSENETLNEKLNETFVNIMANSRKTGISLASFDVAGLTGTGIPQNDSGLLVASRKAVLQFLGEEDSASYLQLSLTDDSQTEPLTQALVQKLPKDFSIKTWKDINPAYKQVNAMNETQYFIISIIMSILVFVSLTQSLATAFNERLYEFGTLEAIGLKKTSLAVLLIMEVILLSLIGIMAGIALAHTLNSLLTILKIEFIPPGYSSGFILGFRIGAKNLFSASVFILCTCIVAMTMPLVAVMKHTVIKLMRHVE